MEELLSKLIETIQYWLVYGFLPYSLIFFLVRVNRRFSGEKLSAFDALACRLVVLSGRLVAACVLLFYLLYTPPEEAWLPYSIGSFEFYFMPVDLFLQMVLVLGATQLLMNPFLRRQLWYRIVVGLMGILATPFFILSLMPRGEFITSSYHIEGEPFALILGLILPGFGLAVVAALFYSIGPVRDRLKK